MRAHISRGMVWVFVNRGANGMGMGMGMCRTQDDMAIMIEGEDGEYYLQAGAILVPGKSLPSSLPSLITDSDGGWLVGLRRNVASGR